MTKTSKDSIRMAIESGAGGTEAEFWAESLLNMYLAYAAGQGALTDISECQKTEHGIAYAQIRIVAPKGLPSLEGEHGIHRLVRVPPSDPEGRRHTSFASVAVETADLEADLELVRTFVFDPYKLVQDHRTGNDSPEPQAVLNGDLSAFLPST